MASFIGLTNGFLVTVLEVPAFIATLTTLFIGRGIILGLTGGKNIAFELKADKYPTFFRIGEINALGFNNQIIVFIIIAAIGAVALAYTSFGWTTYADRRERTGRPLCRHQHALRPDALLRAVLALRRHGRVDESRAE